jgi:hypothetical protein
MDTARTVTATFTQSPVWVSVAVSGGGRVVGSSGGVDCGLACVAGFPLNAQLSLAALPANGYAFTGWGGACSGVGYCSLTMDRIQGVTAGFVPAFPLSLLANPGGVVTLAPGGNSCQGICVLNFRSGSSVTLSAAPASGWRFADWGGACYGVSGDCTVTMNAAQNVTANFLTP